MIIRADVPTGPDGCGRLLRISDMRATSSRQAARGRTSGGGKAWHGVQAVRASASVAVSGVDGAGGGFCTARTGPPANIERATSARKAPPINRILSMLAPLFGRDGSDSAASLLLRPGHDRPLGCVLSLP